MGPSLFTVIPYKNQLIKLENPLRAIAYYRHFAINLLSGERLTCDFSEWLKTEENNLLNKVEVRPRIIHLFYELGFFIEADLLLLDPNSLLLIDIEYGDLEEIKIPINSSDEFNKIKLELLSSPDFDDYKKSYQLGYNELLKGNCYQFNLTYPYLYSFSKKLKPMDFIFSLWKEKKARGAYGSATYIPIWNKLFLSNSPECLFQYKNNILSSMPIKGTIKRDGKKKDQDLWNILKKDQKSQAELYMISDLLRNDLSKIENPNAVIVKKKFPLMVPGLLHQCSKIEVKLSSSISWWQVVKKVFPGGSITGAPKKKAMNIIFYLEKRERGFYCGSTLVFYKKMKSGSINIRSSVVDFENQTLLYQAGGGITLLSEARDEFMEMTYKNQSFIYTLIS